MTRKVRTETVERRALTRLEAAEMAALSPAAFDKARRDGLYPQPTLPGGRYDVELMHLAMNRASGLDQDRQSPSALETWRANRRARKT